jgi:predicted DNA binding protein
MKKIEFKIKPKIPQCLKATDTKNQRRKESERRIRAYLAELDESRLIKNDLLKQHIDLDEGRLPAVGHLLIAMQYLKSEEERLIYLAYHKNVSLPKIAELTDGDEFSVWIGLSIALINVSQIIDDKRREFEVQKRNSGFLKSLTSAELEVLTLLDDKYRIPPPTNLTMAQFSAAQKSIDRRWKLRVLNASPKVSRWAK